MKKLLQKRFSAALFGLALCAVLPSARASGGDGGENPWVPQWKPHHAMPLYFSGTLGVFAPDYHRRYLIAAYRMLSGKPLSAPEIAAFTPKAEPDWAISSASEAAWVDARKAAFADAPQTPVSSDISYQAPAAATGAPLATVYYLNCPSDAYDTAVKTLARVRRQGDVQAARAWLAAQDQVLANCGRKAGIPLPLPATASKVARQDRAYQIASAQFYAQQFDLAESSFLAIAADKDSPWATLGRYLAGRAALRTGNLATDPAKAAQAQARAKTHFDAVLADPGLARWHASARGLIRLMQFRGYDASQQNARMQYWAERFGTGAPATPDVGEDLREFETLMDRAMENTDDHQRGSGTWDLASKPLLDWVSIFQCATPPSTDLPRPEAGARGDLAACRAHAQQRWNATHSPVWAVALIELQHADRKNPLPIPADAAALVRAWPVTHPGYAFAQFHLILDAYRDMALAKPGSPQRETARDSIRRELDRLIALGPTVFPTDSRFLLQNLRVTLARTLDDYQADLFYARQPGYEQDRVAVTAWPALDTGMDSATLWALAQQNAATPKIHDTLEAAAIGRALATGKHADAKARIEQVLTRRPQLRRWFDSYLRADTPAALKTESILLLATQTHLRFSIAEYFEEWPDMITDPARIDPADIGPVYVWWWTGGLGAEQRFAPGTPSPRVSIYADQVMQESAARFGGGDAAAEVKVLKAYGDPTDYLGNYFMAYAPAHRDDARVPFVLHLLVLSTRGRHTPALSKKLFNSLHKNYPNDKWAKGTLYFY